MTSIDKLQEEKRALDKPRKACTMATQKPEEAQTTEQRCRGEIVEDQSGLGGCGIAAEKFGSQDPPVIEKAYAVSEGKAEQMRKSKSEG